ncbi:MAG: hypothetical protein ACYTGZ_00955 [Planctomycetota bacterium]
MIYIGTDEAGYGPLLGPLVIAATVFESDAPRAALTADGVADSKVVYTRRGRAGLGRVLAPCFDVEQPLSLASLLARHSVRGDPRSAYPWYGDVQDVAHDPGPRPAGFRALHVNPVCEQEFNAGCARDGSKGTVLFRETMRAVRVALADLPPDADVDITLDKHGGRRRYSGLLMAELGPRNLLTERETPLHSSYSLRLGERAIRMRFLAKADALDQPVALASMAAKYVRELFMEALNSFFLARRAGLKKTAGYAVDGRRFLEDVQPVLEDLAIQSDTFVRSR